MVLKANPTQPHFKLEGDTHPSRLNPSGGSAGLDGECQRNGYNLHMHIAELWQRCNQAWENGRNVEADALMFELRAAFVDARWPDEWKEISMEVATYCAICMQPTGETVTDVPQSRPERYEVAMGVRSMLDNSLS
jgi:hypothetical protein